MFKLPLVILTLISFFTSSMIVPIGTISWAWADEFHLPAPGVMVHLSPPLDPPILKGIKVYPDNPFRFDFILDKGDSFRKDMSSPNALVGDLQQEQLKAESTKLIKYFLASLTIPEKDLWVNLSPYEKDRIIPQSFGLTEMGRDLLAEDYMLKQITASLIYPEEAIGKKFWKRVYEESEKRYGTTNVSVNTFNKVWIVPQKALVYENAKTGTAYVVESSLKVMLEEDYLSLAKHVGIQSTQAKIKNTNQLGSQIVREIVIPELTAEVNENKNFAPLRQIYNSLILAIWYKNKIKGSILSMVYANKNKTAGMQYSSTVIPAKAGIYSKNDVEGLYQAYLKAFKRGVFNYIKEDKIPNSFDPATGKENTIPRKYFSGGLSLAMTAPGASNQNVAFQVITNPNEIPYSSLQLQEPYVVSATTISEGLARIGLNVLNSLARGINADSLLGYLGNLTLTLPAMADKALLTSVELTERIGLQEEFIHRLGVAKDLPTLVTFADRHGVKDDLENVVEDAKKFVIENKGTKKKLRIIGTGDYFDRGDQNVEVYRLLKKLIKLAQDNPDNLEVHLLWGNHDRMYIEANLLKLNWAQDWAKDHRNLADITRKQFNNAGILEEVAYFMLQHFEVYYYDKDWRHLFVHSGLPVDKKTRRPATSLHKLQIIQNRVKDLYKKRTEAQFMKEVGDVMDSQDLMDITDFGDTEEELKQDKFLPLSQFTPFQLKMRGNDPKVKSAGGMIVKGFYIEDLKMFLRKLPGVLRVSIGHHHAPINLGNLLFCLDSDGANYHYQFSVEGGFEEKSHKLGLPTKLPRVTTAQLLKEAKEELAELRRMQSGAPAVAAKPVLGRSTFQKKLEELVAEDERAKMTKGKTESAASGSTAYEMLVKKKLEAGEISNQETVATVPPKVSAYQQLVNAKLEGGKAGGQRTGATILPKPSLFDQKLRTMVAAGGGLTFQEKLEARVLKAGQPQLIKSNRFKKIAVAFYRTIMSNPAMNTKLSKNNGGIDLSLARNVLQDKNAGEVIEFHVNPAMLVELQNTSGFTPRITNIKPMTDLSAWGINKKIPNEENVALQ